MVAATGTAASTKPPAHIMPVHSMPTRKRASVSMLPNTTAGITPHTAPSTPACTWARPMARWDAVSRAGCRRAVHQPFRPMAAISDTVAAQASMKPRWADAHSTAAARLALSTLTTMAMGVRPSTVCNCRARKRAASCSLAW